MLATHLAHRGCYVTDLNVHGRGELGEPARQTRVLDMEAKLVGSCSSARMLGRPGARAWSSTPGYSRKPRNAPSLRFLSLASLLENTATRSTEFRGGAVVVRVAVSPSPLYVLRGWSTSSSGDDGSRARRRGGRLKKSLSNCTMWDYCSDSVVDTFFALAGIAAKVGIAGTRSSQRSTNYVAPWALVLVRRRDSWMRRAWTGRATSVTCSGR
jgi:hypothetical protein